MLDKWNHHCITFLYYRTHYAVVLGQLPEGFKFIWRFWGGFFLLNHSDEVRARLSLSDLSKVPYLDVQGKVT